MKNREESLLNNLFNKEIRRTEMYFILDFEKIFKTKRIGVRRILSGLMNDEIKEIAVFTKYRMAYTLSLHEIPAYHSTIQRIILKTPSCRYFYVEGEIDDVLDFMNKNLKKIEITK